MNVLKYQTDRPIDLDDSGATVRLFDCEKMVYASASCDVIEGSGSAFVFTIVVSNDPTGRVYHNHPTSTTLTNAARVTLPFSVVGYLKFGIKLTTVNGSNALGHVYLVAKDSPV
jgi:hypothetical protein